MTRINRSILSALLIQPSPLNQRPRQQHPRHTSPRNPQQHHLHQRLPRIQLLFRCHRPRIQKHKDQHIQQAGWGLVYGLPVGDPLVKNHGDEVTEYDKHEDELWEGFCKDSGFLAEAPVVEDVEEDTKEHLRFVSMF